MVICILAIPVFCILAVFSATYRKLAKEAFQCALLKMTLRPCTIGLDTRLRASIVGAIGNKSQRIAGIIYRNFSAISIILLVLTIFSVVGVIYGGINYYLYGNCNGLQSESFCVFDPSGTNNKFSGISPTQCIDHPPTAADVNLSHINLSQYLSKSYEGSNNSIIFIGCYNCKYTRKIQPELQKLVEDRRINFTFVHLPVNGLTESFIALELCAMQDEKVYWNLYNFGFSQESVEYTSALSFLNATNQKIQSCLESEDLTKQAHQMMIDLISAGLYGTPTIVVNGEIIVGPRPLRVYKRLLN